MKYITGNSSIARKRGHWPASEAISLPYLTLPFLFFSTNLRFQNSGGSGREGPGSNRTIHEIRANVEISVGDRVWGLTARTPVSYQNVYNKKNKEYLNLARKLQKIRLPYDKHQRILITHCNSAAREAHV